MAGARSVAHADRLGERAPVGDVELLGPRLGSMPAASNCSGVDDAGERAPEHLAALVEAGPDEGEHRARGRSSGGSAADDLDEGRLDAWVGARTPSAGPCRRPCRRPPGHLHRRSPRRPSCPAPAASRSPTSRCTITSIRSIAGRRRAGRAPAAWRCCRAGWRRAPAASSPSSVGPVERHRVGLDDVARRARRPPRAGRRRGRGRPRSPSPSAPVSASASVSDPRPAPTSTTWSPGPTPARRTMRRTVLASATKFCPRSRRGARWPVVEQLADRRPRMRHCTCGSRRGSAPPSARRCVGSDPG